MKKENEKKGISLVGFIIILIILVCVEGFYIVKLRKNQNPTLSFEETQEIEEPKNDDVKKSQEENKELVISKNEQLTTSLGYDINSFLDNIIDSISKKSEEGKIIKSNETKEIVKSIAENKEEYKKIIKANLDKPEIVTAVNFKEGKLSYEYNIKNVLNLLGLDCENYTEFGANENNIIIYEF